MLKESKHTNGLALPPLAISIEYHLSQNKAITKAAHVDKPRAASTARNLLLHLVKTELLLCFPKQADPTLQKISYCVYHHHINCQSIYAILRQTVQNSYGLCNMQTTLFSLLLHISGTTITLQNW